MQPARSIDPELLACIGWRDDDVAECAAGDTTPEAACQYGVDTFPGLTFTIMDNYTPVGMFGACDFPGRPGVGVAWLLGTKGIFGVIPSFNEQVPLWFNLLNSHYPLLTNWVDDRNTLAKRWLERIGATLIVKEPYGSQGLPFWRFERRYQCDVF